MCSQSADTPALASILKVGIQFPSNVETPILTALDMDGHPLVIGGVPVEFGEGSWTSCELDAISPPEPGNRWSEFTSTHLVPSPAGAGQIEFKLAMNFQSLSSCNVIAGHTLGTWVSDDRDDRFGFLVNDSLSLTTIPCSGNPRDVPQFVTQLLALAPNPDLQCLFDVNQDGLVDGDDIQPFIVRYLES